MPLARPRPTASARRPRDLKPTDPVAGLLFLGPAAPETLTAPGEVVAAASATNPVVPRAQRRRQRSERVQRRASRASCGARAVAREVARLAAIEAPRADTDPGHTAAPHSFDRLDHVGRRIAHGQAGLLKTLHDGVGVDRLELGERVQRRRVEAVTRGLTKCRRPEAARRELHAVRPAMATAVAADRASAQCLARTVPAKPP